MASIKGLKGTVSAYQEKQREKTATREEAQIARLQAKKERVETEAERTKDSPQLN